MWHVYTQTVKLLICGVAVCVEEFLFGSVVSVFDQCAECAHVYSNEFALSGTCIFPIVPNRDFCASGTCPHMRNLGLRPPPVSPLEGVKFFLSITIFSLTAADIATFLSALGAALGSLTSAPEVRGPFPKFGGEGSPTKISLFSTLRFFCGTWDQPISYGLYALSPPMERWRQWTTPTPTVGGAKRYSWNSIFSVTAIDIDAILSLLRATLQSLQSSPKVWGRCPHILGSHPKIEIHVWGPWDFLYSLIFF